MLITQYFISYLCSWVWPWARSVWCSLQREGRPTRSVPLMGPLDGTETKSSFLYHYCQTSRTEYQLSSISDYQVLLSSWCVQVLVLLSLFYQTWWGEKTSAKSKLTWSDHKWVCTRVCVVSNFTEDVRTSWDHSVVSPWSPAGMPLFLCSSYISWYSPLAVLLCTF